MTSDKIEKLDELLKQYIGQSKKIDDVKISRLTAPGDNYGGVLLKVDIKLQSKNNGSKEELHTVAKLIPPNEFMQKLFNIQVTCKKEITFYDTIVPTLQQFQRDEGVNKVIDFFPKLYAARINLDGSDTVDENSVIMLENLVQAGYKNVERMKGLDLETTKLILKDLATFHAVPLALKLKKPEAFEERIKPHLTSFRPQADGNHSANGPDRLLMELINSNEECRPLASKIRQSLDNFGAIKNCKEPFVTICHDDMWVNNFMVKFKDGKPVANKFVDFQLYGYKSPASDLMLFLWSSVRKDILEGYLDDLVKFYHTCLIKNLEQLKCDVTPFSFGKLLAEIEAISKVEMGHVLFMMTFVVFAKKGGIKPNADPTKPPDFGTIEDITPEAKDKVFYMLKTCSKKGWL